ncbi:hypothetical protein [Winogradskyella sp.]|uniref:hypothetical protein n=1 Tax=Winogradskyella sp. TaxID=1883156 RepID=UPI00260D1833|nr:hypothetical protein [Winogradskyella sp.]
MNLFPLNRNSLALTIVGIIGVGFFIAGLLKILDYFIVKALLFGSFGVLFIIASWHALKNNSKKNRPEE